MNDDSATPQAAAKAGRREWIGLAIIALPCLVYAMDLTVLNLALPSIAAALKPSAAQQLWIVDVYGFMVAGFLITMGNLGDRIGRRRLLLIGAAAFGVASTLAALATSADALVLMRGLLGVAGATLAPSTLSLIRNMFRHEHERQFAIGVWMASFSLGGAIGPLVGGALLQWFGWGSVFLVAVPVMALLLVLGPVLLPEYRDPDAGPLDAPSVALSLASVLACVYGLKRLAEHGPGWPAAACVAAGFALGALFVRRQARLAYPLLDLALLRRPRFTAAITAYGLACLAMFGVYIYITQYLQLVRGLAPLAAGWATVPWALGFVAGSLLAPRLARRLPAATVLVGGLVAAAVGFGLIALAGREAGLVPLIAGTVVMSLGLAPVFTLGNEMILTAAPPERAGAASALSETASEFSGALGIALFGSLGTAVYRAALADAMPAGLTAAVRDEALATLGAAVAAAARLSPDTGGALLDAARSAFLDAFRLSALLAAAVLVGTAVLCARILRGARGVPASTGLG